MKKDDRKRVIYPDDSVACPAEKRKVSLVYCLDSFVDANAINIVASACRRCKHGKKVRKEFAAEDDPEPP
jgi:hypothetical protein